MKKNITFLKKTFDKNSEVILIILLLIFFFTESFSKISIFTGQQKSNFQAIPKTIVLLAVSIGILIQKKKKVLYLLILTLSFSIGQYYISDSFEQSSLIYFTKYIFPIAFLGFFSADFSRPKIKLLRVFEYLLVVNSIFIFIGFLFDISFLQSYLGSRFGYNGLLITAAIGTYFHIIGLCYFLIRYEKNMLKKWKFWLLVIAGLLVGTKSIILALAAIGIFYIFTYLKSKKVKISLFAFAVLGTAGFGYYLFFLNPLFLEIKESQGFLTSFLSLRDLLFTEATLPYIQEHWKIINYLFGGVSDFELRPQMELIDLLFFWGIFGSLIYIYFFIKSFFSFKPDKTFIFSVILLFSIALLAGNFFYNASLPIYLLILRESFYLNQQKTV